MTTEVKVLKVGSRKSELALIQTNHVIAELKKVNPSVDFEVVPISTVGDKVLDVALSKIGEKALFTKELEVALEKKEVDFVVHSLKDLPTLLPDGMVIGSVLEREDPRDAVIMKKGSDYKSIADLPENSVIGTSSLRRSAQLKKNFPTLKFEDIRGNLNTRLRKLDDENGVYSAIILAVSGVSRMGWVDRITQYLEPEHCMHAVGQGALGVECREGDVSTLRLLSSLHHRDTLLRCIAERAFLRTLEGGCSVPIAVTSTLTETGINLDGGVWSLDGQESLCSAHSVEFPPVETLAKRSKSLAAYVGIVAENVDMDELKAAEQCGRELADQLIGQGAQSILVKAKADNEK